MRKIKIKNRIAPGSPFMFRKAPRKGTACPVLRQAPPRPKPTFTANLAEKWLEFDKGCDKGCDKDSKMRVFEQSLNPSLLSSAATQWQTTCLILPLSACGLRVCRMFRPPQPLARCPMKLFREPDPAPNS